MSHSPPPPPRPSRYGLVDVADLIGPESESSGTLFGLLHGAGCDEDAHFVRRHLSACAAGLRSEEVRITFGGHFSCGKSTLLNALIGRPLLPTSDYPETGVPCLLRADDVESAYVFADDGIRAIELTQSAIEAEVSLTSESGEIRTSVGRVHHLGLGLSDSPIPDDVVWIDAPGINDSASMTHRAAEAAAQGDVLVWVVTSRQPMSEVEQGFLAERMESDGADSAVFVVNAFLGEDTIEAWDRFRTERFEPYRRRIDYLFPPAALEHDVTFVSALGMLRSSSDFGGAELRALLAELGQVDHPRVIGRRLHRVAVELVRTGDRLARQAARWLTDEQAAAELAARRTKVDQRRAAFAAHLRDNVSAILGAAQGGMQWNAGVVIDEIRRGLLRYDGSYETALARRYYEVLGRVAHDLIELAGRASAEFAQGRPTAALAGRIEWLTQPPHVLIPVPRHPVQTNQRGILESFTAAFVGTVDPAVVRAQALDREAAMRHAVAAAQTAERLVLNRRDELVATILAECPAPLPGPSPAEARMKALRAARDVLLRCHLQAVLAHPLAPSLSEAA